MQKTVKVSDEEIVSSLLQHGTIRAAAQAIGLSERSLYARMDQSSFLAVYQEARNEVLRSSLNIVNNNLTAAVSTVTEIMTDQNVNPSIRLQAARTIIEAAGKFTDRMNQSESVARQYRNPITLSSMSDFLF